MWYPPAPEPNLVYFSFQMWALLQDSPHTPLLFVSILSVLMKCSEWFELPLNWTALSCCVFSAPPPSEPGRRWLRSDPQQQILCLQDCQQRQLLGLLYQWQEGHIQGGRGPAPQPWYWPGPQQIFNLTGNCVFFPSFSLSLFILLFFFFLIKRKNKSCFHLLILSRVLPLFILYTPPSSVGARYFCSYLKLSLSLRVTCCTGAGKGRRRPVTARSPPGHPPPLRLL